VAPLSQRENNFYTTAGLCRAQLVRPHGSCKFFLKSIRTPNFLGPTTHNY